MSFQLIVYVINKITTRCITIPLYEFAALTKGKKIAVKLSASRDGPEKSTYRNKEEMKTKEDYPATEKLW